MVILASQSPYRKKQLRDFGIPFRAVRPKVDESLLKAQWMRENGQPRTTAQFTKLVRFLSLQKAGSIANQMLIRSMKAANQASSKSARKIAVQSKGAKPKGTKTPMLEDTYIIGSDQMAVVGGAKLDKPGTHAKAVSQLRKLRGKTHFLITAVTVIKIASAKTSHRKTAPYYNLISTSTEVVIAKITFNRFSHTEMLETLRADKPYDCAGSYKLEKSGLRLVKKIQVSDASAIIGLPLLATHKLLKKTGFK
jgi:septum formation protein